MNRLNIFFLLLISTFCFAQTETRPELEKAEETETDTLPKGVKKKIVNLIQKSFDDYFVAGISKLDKLYYPPVTTREDLYNRINSYMVNVEYFEIAYHRIKILSSARANNILTLVFQYEKKIDTAYAYYKPTTGSNYGKVGFNIIPGSGINQSSGMFYNQKKNYQSNMDDIAERFGDVYILVKPNEDFLAIHNGKKKISEGAFVNYLLNHGSSYSAYYMIHGLALSKFIKFEYENLIVCGLSQGGYAALINSLQSNPKKAIIASGFSIMLDNPYLSGSDQIIIPKNDLVYNSEGIKLQLQESATQFLFTWGLKETGVYGIEAKEKMTAKFLENLVNVKTYIHPKAHVYYDQAIVEFLESK